MSLFQRFKKQEEPEIQWVCWQDGYHRSFEPMQKADKGPYAPRRSGRSVAKWGGILAIAVAAHFTGATETILNSINHEASSPYAPKTSPFPPARP